MQSFKRPPECTDLEVKECSLVADTASPGTPATPAGAQSAAEGAVNTAKGAVEADVGAISAYGILLIFRPQSKSAVYAALNHIQTWHSVIYEKPSEKNQIDPSALAANVIDRAVVISIRSSKCKIKQPTVASLVLGYCDQVLFCMKKGIWRKELKRWYGGKLFSLNLPCASGTPSQLSSLLEATNRVSATFQQSADIVALGLTEISQQLSSCASTVLSSLYTLFQNSDRIGAATLAQQAQAFVNVGRFLPYQTEENSSTPFAMID